MKPGTLVTTVQGYAQGSIPAFQMLLIFVPGMESAVALGFARALSGSLVRLASRNVLAAPTPRAATMANATITASVSAMKNGEVQTAAITVQLLSTRILKL